jgi:hypothetical protein
MKQLHCNPGDRCVVVADVPGCECNVGAELTVTRLIPVPRHIAPAWEFKDASRPLKMVDLDPHTGRPIVGSTERWATGTNSRSTKSYPGMFDHHLVPLQRMWDAGNESDRRAREVYA